MLSTMTLKLNLPLLFLFLLCQNRIHSQLKVGYTEEIVTTITGFEKYVFAVF